VIDINFAHKNIDKYMKCDSVKELKAFNILGDKSKANTIHLLKCTNYQGIR